MLETTPAALASLFPLISIDEIVHLLQRPEYADLLRDLRSWRKEGGVYELIGKKDERVIVLGAFDTWHDMKEIARYVSQELGYYAITSLYMFPKNRGPEDRVSIRPYNSEFMNDYLRRLILSCHYAMATYTGVQSGQLIETGWCSEFSRATLGIVLVRDTRRDSETCRYLYPSSAGNFVNCQGWRAIEQGEDVIGAWICTKQRCPFVKQDLSKMVLDFYMTNPRMYLIGAEDVRSCYDPIKLFLDKKGFVKSSDW